MPHSRNSRRWVGLYERARHGELINMPPYSPTLLHKEYCGVQPMKTYVFKGELYLCGHCANNLYERHGEKWVKL